MMGEQNWRDWIHAALSKDHQLHQPTTWLEYLVVLAVIVGFAMAGGLPGAALGIGLAGLWLRLPNHQVFAVGVIGVAALVPANAGTVALAVPVAALGGLLASRPSMAGWQVETGAVLLGWGLLVALTTELFLLSDALWVSAAGLLGVSASGFVFISTYGPLRLSGGTDE